MYEYIGKVSNVCDMQTFSSGFSKRELVVEEKPNGKLTPHATFNFKGENISKLDQVRKGDEVKVGFVLDGREWQDPRTNKIRHFTDLVGITLDILSTSCSKTPKQPIEEEPSPDEVTPF